MASSLLRLDFWLARAQDGTLPLGQFSGGEAWHETEEESSLWRDRLADFGIDRISHLPGDRWIYSVYRSRSHRCRVAFDFLRRYRHETSCSLEMRFRTTPTGTVPRRLSQFFVVRWLEGFNDRRSFATKNFRSRAESSDWYADQVRSWQWGEPSSLVEASCRSLEATTSPGEPTFLPRDLWDEFLFRRWLRMFRLPFSEK